MTSNEWNSLSDKVTQLSTVENPAQDVQKGLKQTAGDGHTKHERQKDILQPMLNKSISETESAEESDVPEIGTSCTVMKLWEGRSSKDRLVWLTEPPEVEAEEKPVSELPRYAITLLHRPSKDKGNQILDTIIMRGPELRKFLDDTIPNVSSFYNEAEHGIAMRSPFRLLFWNMDHIDAAAKGPDEKLSRVTRLLQRVLTDEFRELLARRKEMVATQEINFKTLWTLFKPDITCLTSYAGNVVAVKVVSIEYSHDAMGNYFYRIKYTFLAWDGESLGWQDSYTDILEFTGRRKIKALDIFPVEFHADPTLLSRLASRGKRFSRLAVKEPCMMSFNGEALDREISPMWWQGEQKKMMSERVVLDSRAYNHYFRRLFVDKWMKRDELNEALVADKSDQTIFMYCCPELHCFALQHKKWVRVWIDDLEEVAFNESAYRSLVLPGDYKELLLAFAEAQIDGYRFDDVIAGKGQGILMLLAGPPGIGKTLTAEAMAEHMKRPLYSVSAGELGASAGGLENELDRVLELSTRWNAILLLDEADVFLERRTDNDLQRNSITSVFLRKLEYYRGIMFLTTNRIHSFDEAFRSRIHIAMRYPDLDARARRSIWFNFLNKARDLYQHGVDVSAAELDRLAQMTLNGREIRNIVKTAQLLAARSQQPLQSSHIHTVWRVEHEDSAWEPEREKHQKAPNELSNGSY